ncbi:hypothetical protein PINS_up009817 [Pythium insidiosum]|nr:hypothetical protein PINS_up009817 [Pythium insidiosum]
MSEEQESIVAIATSLAAVRHHAGPFSSLFEALDDIEQLLFHHKDAFGILSARFQQGCEEFVLLCNTIAMQQLQAHRAIDEHERQQSRDIALCGELLRRAEQHTRRGGYLRSIDGERHVSRRIDLRLVSLNNLACFHKQGNKPLLAIGFLEKALRLQLKQADPSVEAFSDGAIALTHLNLCAVLSQLSRHDAAAEHARAAIALLQSSQQGNGSRDVNMLLIAQYNLAVECEHLRDARGLRAACDTALRLARDSETSAKTNDVVRLLEDMARANAVGTAPPPTRRLLSPRVGRPPSPRTLRQVS